jgi:hypothetical protein
MREKQLWLLITFPTTASAMALEEAFQQAGLPGRLIPVPTSITADCGLAWRTEPCQRAASEALAARHNLDIDAFYELPL